MITAVCFLALAATVPLLGGRLSRLGEIRLKAWWTIIAALVVQVLLIEVFAASFGGVLAAALHLGSYALALLFVWHNRRVTGIFLIVAGGLLNLAAIAANGGVMPAQRGALETAGIIADSAGVRELGGGRRRPSLVPGRRLRHPRGRALRQRLQRRRCRPRPWRRHVDSHHRSVPIGRSTRTPRSAEPGLMDTKRDSDHDGPEPPF